MILHYNGNSFEWRDLYDTAVKVLSEYAEKLIQHMEFYFQKFDRKLLIILGGGGSNHKPLMNIVKAYLKKKKYKTVEPDKEIAVISGAVGYKMIAKQKYGKLGIAADIGNNTLITVN